MLGVNAGVSTEDGGEEETGVRMEGEEEDRSSCIVAVSSRTGRVANRGAMRENDRDVLAPVSHSR